MNRVNDSLYSLIAKIALFFVVPTSLILDSFKESLMPFIPEGTLKILISVAFYFIGFFSLITDLESIGCSISETLDSIISFFSR